MRSFLIVGGSSEERIKKFEEFSNIRFNHQENNPDFLHIFPEEKDSISINQIREVQKLILLKPFTGDSINIIISEADKLTTDAQSALLKILEETPSSVFFYLLCPNSANLLPTILSRVQIINLTTDLASTENNEEIFKIFSDLISSGPGKRLAYIENLGILKENKGADLRISIDNWFNNLQFVLRNSLLEKYTIPGKKTSSGLSFKNYFSYISLITKFKKYLSANCNTKLVFECFVLEL